jgi:hypothetical protein
MVLFRHALHLADVRLQTGAIRMLRRSLRPLMVCSASMAASAS